MNWMLAVFAGEILRKCVLSASHFSEASDPLAQRAAPVTFGAYESDRSKASSDTTRHFLCSFCCRQRLATVAWAATKWDLSGNRLAQKVADGRTETELEDNRYRFWL